jgi:hypothetical protein
VKSTVFSQAAPDLTHPAGYMPPIFIEGNYDVKDGWWRGKRAQEEGKVGGGEMPNAECRLPNDDFGDENQEKAVTTNQDNAE